MSSTFSLGHLGVIHQELYALRADYFLIIFGVTTGLMVLVGFASLYFMTETKQKADKLRELLQRMSAAKYKPFSRGLAHEMIDSISLYMDELRRNKHRDPNLASLLIITVGFVMLTWLSTVILLDSTIEFALFGLFYSVSACILLAFMVKLNKFRKMSADSFPTGEQLLDANHHLNVDAVYLAATTSKVLITRNPNNEDEVSIFFGFPHFIAGNIGREQRFSNLRLSHSSIYLRNGDHVVTESTGLSQLLSKPAECIPGSSYDWYEVKYQESIDLHPITKTIELASFLTAQQENGTATQTGVWVSYEIEIDDRSMTNVLLYPTQIIEGTSTDIVKSLDKNPQLV